MSHGERRTGVRLAFVCLVLLGVMPVITNGRPPGATALTFSLGVTLWQLLFALPLQLREWRSGERGVFRRDGPPIDRRRVLAGTVFTGLLFALSTWGYILALEKVGAVNAAIALQIYPLFAAGLEALVLGRGKTRTEWAFTALIVVALYHLATRGTWQMAGLSRWFALALAVPALWSVAHFILRQAMISTPITPNQVTTSRLAVSASLLLPLALVVDGPDEIARAAGSVGLQSFAVMMGLAYYAELILWYHAVRRIEVSVASAITVPAPVVTTILAVLLLGERARGYQFVALTLVVVGLLGLLRVEARRASGRSDVGPGPADPETPSQAAHPPRQA